MLQKMAANGEHYRLNLAVGTQYMFVCAARAANGVLDKLFIALQQHNLIKINVECLGLDSTSVKVHPDGTGALKKTVSKPLENLAGDGTQRFIWLPRMIG
jgi:hypothetical protein